ncbi:MAG TPA: RlmE family RNA methyltransferase [Burkholderiales bacterium]|nr:RlmE family RNA methyltransferase [Burkholderiales bacterium]
MRSKSSRAWMRSHVGDPYVRRARREGYRSRAAYKLLEIDARDRLFKPGMTVIDLGAAPGGWSQVAAAKVEPHGKVIAIDLIEMEPISGVTFIQGDFEQPEAQATLRKALGGQAAGIVICDLAPNLSGIAATDQARSMRLAEQALLFCDGGLKPGGSLLVKTFHGAGLREFTEAMRRSFLTVMTRKPSASRSRSSEIYLLGKGFRPGAYSAGAPEWV